MKHAIMIELDDSAYVFATEKAQRYGFVSVEDFVNDCLLADDDDLPVTSAVRKAIEVGLADMSAGRMSTTEEVNQHLAEVRARWISEHAQ